MLSLLQSAVIEGQQQAQHRRALRRKRWRAWRVVQLVRPEDVTVWSQEAMQEIEDKRRRKEHEDYKRRLWELTLERRRRADEERRRRADEEHDKSWTVFIDYVVACKAVCTVIDFAWWLVISVDAGEFLFWQVGGDLWWRWYEGQWWWIRHPRW